MKWINLEDKLPKKGCHVLLYDKMFDRVDVCLVDNPNLIDADYTHWMPLPETPK